MSSLSFSENGIVYPLYDWQAKAKKAWEDNGNAGIVAAVTGSGKTRLAKAIMSKWFSDNPDGSVSIIVSKISLLDQWKDELAPVFYDRNIGRMGGGHKEWYGGINILVIDTAVKVLGGRQGGLSEAHLVIVDECHTLGAETYREALTCLNHATLGLSATPEREDTGLDIIAPLIGDVIFRYSYREAIRDGVIPPFTLKAVKVELQPNERLQYDNLQFKIRNYSKNLSKKYGGGGNLIARCQYLLNKGTKDADIGGFLTAVREQKELVNSAKNRFAVLDILLHKHITVGEQQTMLFHESVPEIQSLAKKYAHLNPLEYHYKVTSSKKKRKAILDSFKDGKSKLLLSCRALSEGFNPPKAEIGIMLSGTRSVRSRIQTLGRLLRGEDATVYFLYVCNTKDTRSLSNLIKKADIPEEHIEYWEYVKSKGAINPVVDVATVTAEIQTIFEDEKKWDAKKKAFGEAEPLICIYCCRGMEGSKTRPFRTKNGQEGHMRGCKSAQRQIYGCMDCNKSFISEVKRTEHAPNCKGWERMTWDDFMSGFDTAN